MSLFSVANISLRGITAVVPKNRLKNKDLEGYTEIEKNQLINTVGIKERRVSTPEICTSDLCVKAAEKLLVKLGWKNSDIEIIFVVTQTPDHVLPGTSFLIREKLNLNSSCIAMDLNQGCAGYIYGLSAISTFMSSIKAKKGLLLVGDTITKLISPEDNSLIPVFSDAGTATAIEYDENAEDIYFDLCADATGYDAIIVPDGGARNPINLDSLEIKKVNEKIKRAPIHLTMNGHDVFNFGFTKVAPSIPAFMKAINITSDDVDYLILHQANKLLNESIRKKAGFTPEKVPYSIEKYGNTSCATIPLTIVSELKDRVYNKQTSFILTGFGVGLSWGNAYIKTERLVCSSVIEI